MRDMKGFFPNFFLGWLGTGVGRPAWFVMLLAAMASGAVYTVAWAVLVLLARGGALFAEAGASAAAAALLALLLWGSSTLWYHLVYMAGYHRAAAAEAATETDGRFVVWGGALFWLVVLVGKALWILLKYAVAPLFPLVLVMGLKDVPAAGDAACVAACAALAAYPFACLGAHAVHRARQRRKEG